MLSSKTSFNPDLSRCDSSATSIKSHKSPLLAILQATTRKNTPEDFKQNSYVFQGQYISDRVSYLRKTVGSLRNIDEINQVNPKSRINPILRQTSFVSLIGGYKESQKYEKTEEGSKRSATGELARQISRGQVAKRQLSFTSSGQSNYDRIIEKLDEKQKLINELKKLSEIKVSKRLRNSHAVDLHKKIELDRSIAQGGQCKDKKGNIELQVNKQVKIGIPFTNPQKNPEQIQKKSNFEKNKNVYYTPKTEKTHYEHKLEKMWTPNLKIISNMDERIRKSENIDKIKKISSNLSYLPHQQGFVPPLANRTDGKDLKLLSKDFQNNSRITKHISQISEIKSINKNIKNNQRIFNNQKLSLKDFKLGKMLGDGKFGTVYQVLHKQTQSVYALKKVSKEAIKSSYMIEQFILQIKIQIFCNNDNILKLYSFFDDSQHIYLILEYMEEGTLYSHLKKNKMLPQRGAAQKLKKVAQAVNYLHQNGIAHRDIKPENIVMSYGVGKLCDFGWAAICNQRRKTYCGTFDYAAPQILEGSQYDMSVDLWCLGVLAYQLLVGKAPFYHISRKQTMKKILNVNLKLSQVASTSIEYPSYLSKNAISFIENLIKKRPEDRMNCEQVLKHPLLSQDAEEGKP